MALPLRDILAQTVPATGPAQVPPDVARFIAEFQARPASEALPSPSDEANAAIDAAMGKDRERAGLTALAQNLSRAGSLYRGERVGAMASPPLDDALKAFVLQRQTAQQDAAAAAGKEAADWKRGMDVAGLGLKGQEIEATRARAAEARAAREAESIADREFRASESERDRANRIEAARVSAGNRAASLDAREAARDDKKAGQLYAGTFFKFRPDVPAGAIPDGTRSELIDQTGLVADVADASDQLVGLYQQHGSQIAGPSAAKMRTLVTDIRLVAKSPAIYNLGVLSGPDLDILRTVVDDPTQLEGIFKNQAKLREFVTEIETFRNRTVARLSKRWESFGADPVAGPFVKQNGGGGEVSTGPKRIASDADYEALPSGAQFIDPEGNLRRKP